MLASADCANRGAQASFICGTDLSPTGFLLGGETRMGRIDDSSTTMAMACRPRVYDPFGPSIFTISCGPKKLAKPQAVSINP